VGQDFRTGIGERRSLAVALDADKIMKKRDPSGKKKIWQGDKAVFQFGTKMSGKMK
jgi:hypothetical protein